MSEGEQMLNAFDVLAGLMIVAWEVPDMPGHPDAASRTATARPGEHPRAAVARGLHGDRGSRHAGGRRGDGPQAVPGPARRSCVPFRARERVRARLAGHDVLPPHPGEPTLWDEAADYWWWLERFGLTPDQVDLMPAWLHSRIPHIARIADEVSEEKARRDASSR
jgi:hypothetical protein